MTTNKILFKPNFLVLKFGKKTKDQLFYGLASLVVVAIIVMLAANPKAYSSTTLQGLNLFVVAVLPGLLPFMFLTKVLTSLGMVKKLSARCSRVTNVLFGTPGISGYVMLMSMLSGYPIGAKLIADLYSQNAISKANAKRMISFCTTSGPIFVIGSVGSIMFGSAKIGIVLYLAHIIGSIMCGIALNMLEKMGLAALPIKKHINKQNSKPQLQSNKDNSLKPTAVAPQNQLKIATQTSTASSNADSTKPTPERLEKIIADSMTDSVSSILVVGAYIAIFFLFAQMLMDIGLLKGLASVLDKFFALFNITGVGNGVAGGLLEVTRGCSLLAKNTSIGSICLTCGVLSFSGLSIIMQSMNFLHRAGITTGYFVAIKIFNAIISALVCLPLCLAFGL